MFDKDIMFNDFLGKISLTLDQLKEISLKVCQKLSPVLGQDHFVK